MYPDDPRAYPPWIIDAFNDDAVVKGSGIFLDFPSARIAESARCRMYAYLKATCAQRVFTIKRKGAQLIVTKQAPAGPAKGVVPNKAPVPQIFPYKLDEAERQLLVEHGLKLKTHTIGTVTYYGIDTGDGSVQYHPSAMEAIMWFLNKPPTTTESPSPTTPPNLSETYKEIQDASDDQMRALGYGVSTKEVGK